MFRSKGTNSKNGARSRAGQPKGVTPITSFFQSRSSSSISSFSAGIGSPSSSILSKGQSPSAKVAISPNKITSIGSAKRSSEQNFSQVSASSSSSSSSSMMSAKKNLFDSLSQPAPPPSQTSSFSRMKRSFNDGFEDDEDTAGSLSSSQHKKYHAQLASSSTQHELEFIKERKRRTTVQNFKPPSLMKSGSSSYNSSSSLSSFASFSSTQISSSQHGHHQQHQHQHQHQHQQLQNHSSNSFGSHGRTQYSSKPSLKSMTLYNNPPMRHASNAIKNNSILSSGSGSSNISGFTSDEGIRFTSEQKAVLDYIVRDNLNVFYTGSAGTGKSIVLKTIIKKLKMKFGPSAVAVCASTGLASVNIGGITIHKFCGFGIGSGTLPSLVNMVKKNKTSLQRWKDTRVLIIDEISMIDGTFLDKLDFVARQVLNSSKPFGGIQMVLTGDFFQLPPVDNKKNGNGGVKFCFQSDVWSKAINKTILFKQVFRQKDNDLIDMLNEIRYGENVSTKTMNLIRSLDREVVYDDNIEPTELYPTRNEVLQANFRRMEKLEGFSKLFRSINVLTEAEESRKKQQLNQLNNSFLVEDELHLKENAQVMMVKNIDEELVNGTVGIVLFFTSEDIYTRSINIYKGIPKETYIKEMRLLSRCFDVHADKELPEQVLNYMVGHDNLVRVRMEFLINKIRSATKSSSSGSSSGSSSASAHLLPLVKFSLPNNRFKTVLVQKEEFKIELSKSQRDNYIARVQLPLILCYAISIHKAQGQTIQRLKVDLKKVFEVGQIYVALSRAVSKDCLEIKNFNLSQLKANDTVKLFYKSLKSIAE